MFNKHYFYDSLTAILGSFASGKNKFFAKSLQSKDLKTHINASHVEEIEIIPGHQNFKVDSLEGPLDASILIHRLNEGQTPTIIYHHGNNENPLDFTKSLNTFKSIFIDRSQSIPANLIVIRAPYHDLPVRQYQEKIVDLSKFMAMLAVSVRIAEELTSRLHALGSAPVVISGISLGGWVTNLHRTFFNSADLYVPLLAGAALDDVFISSKYRKMTGALARSKPDQIVNALNFEEQFHSVPTRNVYPLLARYDQFIRYDRQKQSYENHPVKVIDKGHITAALASQELHDHILSSLRRHLLSARLNI